MAIKRVNVLEVGVSVINLETFTKTVVGGKIADDFNPIINDIKVKKDFSTATCWILGP